MIFHVSNLKTRVLDPPTHSCQFDANCGKIQYVSDPFFLILKLSHVLDGLLSVSSRLHGRKHKCTFCWMKDHWMWPLSDIVAWDSFWHGTHYLFSDIDALTATFHVLINTYFFNFRLAPMIVLRALVHLICLVIFNNFLVFNFSFLILNNNFLFLG